jgi:pimeloyl-ACP methyl ester carboxylesterase
METQDLNSSYGKSHPLHHIEVGQGAPVLLLHGFGANLATWRHLIRPLAAIRRVIAVDLIGCGESPKPRNFDYSLLSQARAVLDFIDAKDLTDLVLVGHSMGGGIALLVATAWRQAARPLLRGLVVIDSISYAQPLPLFMKLLRTPLIGSLALKLPVEIQVRYVLRRAYYDRKKITSTTVADYANPLRTPAARYALLATARHLIPDDIDEVAKTFPTITVPTLILWGRQDAIVPLANGQRLYNAIVGSDMAIIDYCGHVPPEEMPARTLETLREFVLKVSPPGHEATRMA